MHAIQATQATHTTTQTDGIMTVSTIMFVATGGATGESKGGEGRTEPTTTGGETETSTDGGTGDNKGDVSMTGGDGGTSTGHRDG